MMYPYLTLFDETEITHSHLIEENGNQRIEVHFERPTEDGFYSARCELPSYTWIVKEGFSNSDIDFFTTFLQSNAHLIFKYAMSGGVRFESLFLVKRK